MVLQEELCPTTARQHFQGYLELQVKKRLSWLKENLSATAHFEKARGSRFDNYTYCSKRESAVADTFTLVCGITPTQKTDWEEAKAAAKRGDLDDPAIPAHLYLRSYRTLKEIAADHAAKPVELDSLDNFWLWGATGVGKSRAARSHVVDYYVKPKRDGGTDWWIGYTDEHTVIIEDVDASHAPWLTEGLKVWADHYPFPAHTGVGQFKSIRPHTIIVTSNCAPCDIWQEPHLAAIERRFKIIEVTPENRDSLFSD